MSATPFHLTQVAKAIPLLIHIGIIRLGQSNQQGASVGDNGGSDFQLLVCKYTGRTDPFQGNANGGGSCLGRLSELGIEDGIYYEIVNLAIGGSSVRDWAGVVGATVTGGSSATPLAGLNMSGVGLSAGTGVASTPGGSGFDPFGLLARIPGWIAKYPQIKKWVVTWANAESDGGTSAALYQGCIETIANYVFGLTVPPDVQITFMCGLSSSGGNSSGNMDRLQGAYRAALTKLASEGRRVAQGTDLYDVWGMHPPLYEERSARGTIVHLTMGGQERYALEERRSLWSIDH